MKYVIIGAGMSGTTAAETIRSMDASSEIILITEEPYSLYSRITVTSYAGGKVKKENLILKKEEYLKEKNITFLKNTKVIALDKNSKNITIKRSDTTETLSYDKLLISTGGTPIKLNNVEGSDGKGIFYMHTLDEGTSILEYSRDKKKAVVIGGGFIAIDFIIAFLDLGLSVDLIIRDSRFLGRLLDNEASGIVQNILKEKGVNIRVSTNVTKFNLNESGEVVSVATDNGDLVECDIVGLGLGIDRIPHFIKGSDIKYNQGILTNEYLQTSDESIFASGDSAEYFDVNFNEYSLTGDWVSARLEGLAAGKNMLGEKQVYSEVGNNIVNLFGVSLYIIGKFNENLESFVSCKGNVYRRIYCKDGIIQGGVVIGDSGYATKVKLAIKSRIKASSIDI